jgi:hypothetical protein
MRSHTTKGNFIAFDQTKEQEAQRTASAHFRDSTTIAESRQKRQLPYLLFALPVA